VLDGLPRQYADWRVGQERLLGGLAPRRIETARLLLAGMDAACGRIAGGIALPKSDPAAREALAIMNEAVAIALRQRKAATKGVKPQDVDPPAWRPFQLAFILLNLVSLTQKESREREIVDLLFFPTGGGKTEAYLGLAAYAIALRGYPLETFVDRGELRKLAEPTVTATGKRVPGLDHPRQRAVMHALVRFAQVAAGNTFTPAEIHPYVIAALGCPSDAYKLAALRYDLSKLRAKGLIAKLPRSRRYQLLPHGYSICLIFLKLSSASMRR
jgi:hypothetical protein